MAIAVRTNTNLAATITQSSLANAIKAAMVNAGFSSSYDDYTSTNRNLVYEWIIDENKIYGKLYIFIGITTGLVISVQILTSWNTANKTGTGASLAVTFSALTTGSSINFTAFNGGSEIRLIQLVQGSIVIPIGLIVPASRPNWWDLNSWNYGFMPAAANFTTWKSTTINPYSNENYQFFIVASTFLSTANPQTNKRDVITGLLLTSSSLSGIAGKTSDDIAAVAASGSSRYDTIQPTGTTQVFTILSNASGGLAVRTS